MKQVNLARLDSALKRMNQRIVQLEKTFGKNSSVVSSAVAQLENKEMETFVKEYERMERGVSKGKTKKIAVSKVLNELKKGNKTPQLEKILNLAGYTTTKSGEIKETKQGEQIKTVTELKKEYIRDFGEPKDGANIIDKIEESFSLGDDLTELLYDVQKRFGKEPRGMDAIEKYFPEVVNRDGRALSKEEVEKLKLRAKSMILNNDPEAREAAAKKAEDLGKKKYSNGSVKNKGVKNE